MLLRNLINVVETLAIAKREIVVVSEFAIAACYSVIGRSTQRNLVHQTMWTPTLATATGSMPSPDGMDHPRRASLPVLPGMANPCGMRRDSLPLSDQRNRRVSAHLRAISRG